ncbi:hypothetical protein AJ78_05116 [Emergomyces pasteurianus Ep9510]|uniref:Uncharacterized protein n=1 Tax=Emergomyces pasteurianus Ep9510 TaxID=1447872 RepID=A0A1J9QEH1_9EURO|nr:hypothetical protein AJ78_05116 [Emergomyces pasteurianus Ep9510]
MADQGSKGSGNIDDKIKGATQPGDSKTTTQQLSDTVQQGVESAKQYADSAAESAKDAASKASEAASGALGGGKSM